MTIKVTLTGVDLEPHPLHLVGRQVSGVIPFSDIKGTYLLSLYDEKSFLLVLATPTTCDILSTLNYHSRDYLWSLLPIYDSHSTLRFALLRF